MARLERVEGNLYAFRFGDPISQNRGSIIEAELVFQQGMALEDQGDVEGALALYRRVIALNPAAAGAWLNLGTIEYCRRNFAVAEDYYRKAVAIDPDFPLAHFNLGNLFDEMGRSFEQTVACYEKALELKPDYADAHFNIALFFERRGEDLQAINHWRAYLKCCGTGSNDQWCVIAREQLKRLLEKTIIKKPTSGVSETGSSDVGEPQAG